jgi:hypothetical protein
MRVLIVSSGNAGQISPFVHEQVESIKIIGVEFEYFNVVGRGAAGYLKNISPLKQRIKSFRPDIIHAHYGLSGFLSLLIKGRAPLITTFHGNDINSLHPLKGLYIYGVIIRFLLLRIYQNKSKQNQPNLILSHAR